MSIRGPLMWPSVRAAFPSFSKKFEGEVPFLYLDIKGLVTCAIGNMVSLIEAQHLEFLHKDGRVASKADIADDYARVLARQDQRKYGGFAYASIAKLRLTKEAIQKVVYEKLDDMAEVLVRRFPCFPEWPADAQLGTLSIAWACGENFRFPRWEAHAHAREWAVFGDEGKPQLVGGAAKECFMSSENVNPGLKPRNAANRILFLNAYQVEEQGSDPTTLYYPDRPEEQ